MRARARAAVTDGENVPNDQVGKVQRELRVRAKILGDRSNNSQNTFIKQKASGVVRNNPSVCDKPDPSNSRKAHKRPAAANINTTTNTTDENERPKTKLRKLSKEEKNNNGVLADTKVKTRTRPERAATVRAGVRLSCISQYEKRKMSTQDLADIESSNISGSKKSVVDSGIIGLTRSDSDSSRSSEEPAEIIDAEEMMRELEFSCKTTESQENKPKKESTMTEFQKQAKDKLPETQKEADDLTTFGVDPTKKKKDIQVTIPIRSEVESKGFSFSTELHLPYDKKNVKEHQLSPYYAHDIFTYLKAHEAEFKPFHYMPNRIITSSMRAVLNDWLMEVQELLEITHETIYLAVKITDFFLMKEQISRTEYQLLGTTALFIACKYDERLPPSLSDFISLCDGAYTENDVTSLEINVLKAIDFNLSFPLSYRFLRRYSNVQNNSFRVLTMARYILECSLLEYDFVFLSDSKLAAASLMLAHQMLDSGTWCEDVQYASGYTRDELVPLMKALNDNLHKVITMHATRPLVVVRKYAHEIFCKVSTIPLLPKDSIE